MPEFDGLLVVVAIAFAAPFLLGLHRRGSLPPVVLEIVAGILVGPSVFGLVELDATIEVVSVLGLAFVLFLAGLEIDVRALRGPLLRAVLVAFALSLLIAAAVAGALGAFGVVQTPLLVAVVLSGTALGVLVPILKDTDEARTTFGQLVIAAGSVADIATIVLLSVLFSRDGGTGSTVVLLGVLLGGALVVFAVLTGAARVPPIRAELTRLQDTSAQIRLRGAMVLLIGFAALAEALGLEVILGAFIAGVVVALVDGEGVKEERSDVRAKVEATGFGFFVPVFFVATGISFDLDALLAEPASAATIPIFLVALLAVRGLPAFLYRRQLGLRRSLVAGLMQATSLPLVVAATSIGVELGLMDAAERAGLIAAGLLSVLVLPVAALGLLRREGQRPPVTARA
jgi:Kef-type K+ transport system membrane component KefB